MIGEQQKLQLEQTFGNIRGDLKRLVQSRLDRRLYGRVDASDIVQDAYLVAVRRYQEYLDRPEVPLIDWIRFLTIQSVKAAHRFHLGRQRRSVGREVTAASEDLSIVAVADMIAGSLTSPHSKAIKAELQKAVRALIESMSDIDREILRLRHEEMLANDECAKQIGISRSAASKRYIRALKRLRSVAKEYIE